MTLFATGAVLMVTGILMALLLPLFSTAPRAAETGRDAYDRTVYRDQLTEIDRDLELGLFSAEEAEAARIEVQRRMIEAEAADGATAAPPAAGRRTAAAAVLMLPAAAALLYLQLGRPGTPDLPLAQRAQDVAAAQQRPATQRPVAQPGMGAAGPEHTDMAQLAAQLTERLKQDPDNAEGWNLLARSYVTLERYADAATAYERAADLTGRNPDTLSAWAEVLTRAHDGRVPPNARRLFEEATQKDPEEPRARFYIGLAKAQAGDVKGAFDSWVALAESSPADAPWMPTVQGHIQQAAQRLGIEAPVIAGTPPAPAMPRGPSQADMEAAQQMSPEDRNAMIRSMVERLAERLKDNPNDRDGWVRLGRSYQVLGDTQKAEDAFAKAQALSAGAAPPPTAAPPPGPSRADVEAAQQMSVGDRADMIRGMVQRLADRLKENPDDREGWLRLGRSYQVLGDTEKAEEAFAKAKALGAQ